MWIYIFINFVLSILVVLIGHYLWNYLKDTYSTKKTKDLVEYQTRKYKEIISEIQSSKKEPPQHTEYISPEEKQTMIDELKSLLIDDPIPEYIPPPIISK